MCPPFPVKTASVLRLHLPERIVAAFSLMCVFSAWSFAAENAVARWVSMPAGARPTYIGIHGGTVPVSLWATRDCTHMVALAGRTGNDFLRTLRASIDDADTALEQANAETSGTNDTQTAAPAPLPPSSRFAANATVLMAGTAVGKMPVLYATGHSFAGMAPLYADILPFGLFERSPLLEGAVKAPPARKKKRRAM